MGNCQQDNGHNCGSGIQDVPDESLWNEPLLSTSRLTFLLRQVYEKAEAVSKTLSDLECKTEEIQHHVGLKGEGSVVSRGEFDKAEKMLLESLSQKATKAEMEALHQGLMAHISSRCGMDEVNSLRDKLTAMETDVNERMTMLNSDVLFLRDILNDENQFWRTQKIESALDSIRETMRINLDSAAAGHEAYMLQTNSTIDAIRNDLTIINSADKKKSQIIRLLYDKFMDVANQPRTSLPTLDAMASSLSQGMDEPYHLMY